MSHTYTQILYHLVWSTKERAPLILPQFQEPLYKYISEILKNLGALYIKIGGMPDHIHILVEIPATIAIAKLVRETKVSTSKWMKKNSVQSQDFSWQEGYGAFTISRSHLKPVVEYIQNQAKHHEKRSFRDEFLALLYKNNIEFEEKYLWK